MEHFAAMYRAMRVWRQAPGVSLAIITLLAIGIGGVTALFSPLYSLVLAPLPFPAPDRLVRLGGKLPLFNVYFGALESRDRLAPIFEYVTAYAPVIGSNREAQFAATGRPRHVNTLAVTPEFFETLGVPPRIGSGFLKEPNDSSAVVISDRLWRAEFDGSDAVVGTTIWIRQQTRTVSGVMPPGFDFGGDVDLWVLVGNSSYAVDGLEVIGRLREGFAVQQAAVALDALGLTRMPGPSGQVVADGLTVQTLHSFLRGETAATIWLLWAVSGLLLLATCLGAVNLLLSHGVRRRQEIVVRLALGSTRWRLVQQLSIETLLLAGAAAFVGVAISAGAGQLLRTQLPPLRGGRLFVPATMVFAIALTFLVTIVCGLAPALYASRAGVPTGLAAGPTGTSSLTSRRRFLVPHELFAGLQLAVALALLIGSALLLRSLSAGIDRPLGFQPDDVAVFQSQLPVSPALAAATEKFRAENNMTRRTYGPLRDEALLARMNEALKNERRAERTRNALFVQSVYDRVSALPAVLAVGAMSPPPFSADAAARIVTFLSPAAPGGPGGVRNVRATRAWASPNGFEVLGIPLLSGRAFTAEDVANVVSTAIAEIEVPTQLSGKAPSGVAIINDAVAQRLWPGHLAIGKQFDDPYDRFRSYTVVGVVGNARWTEDGRHDGPAVFYPFAGFGPNDFVVRLRPDADLQELASEVDKVVTTLMPGLTRPEIYNLRALTDEGQHRIRMTLALLGSFAALASVVAGLGVHAASALMAAARTREAGIRSALGASGTEIRFWILLRSARPLLVGIPLGLLGGWALSRELSHMLVQIAPTDVVSYLVSAGFLLVVAFIASVMPALRAASIVPAEVLRAE